jgi:hypothetical protein
LQRDGGDDNDGDVVCSDEGDGLIDWTSNCTDDPGGVLQDLGYNCDTIDADCDADLSISNPDFGLLRGSYLAVFCPVSCNNCDGNWRPPNVAAVVVEGVLMMARQSIAEFTEGSPKWQGLKKAIADTFRVTPEEVVKFLVRAVNTDVGNQQRQLSDEFDIEVNFQISSETLTQGDADAVTETTATFVGAVVPRINAQPEFNDVTVEADDIVASTQVTIIEVGDDDDEGKPFYEDIYYIIPVCGVAAAAAMIIGVLAARRRCQNKHDRVDLSQVEMGNVKSYQENPMISK